MRSERDARLRTGVWAPMVHILPGAVQRVCLVAALITDIVYSRTADMMWANFSAWLLAFGLLFGVLAAILALIGHWLARAPRASGPVWPHVIGSLVVLLLAFFNNLVHTRDGWTSVVPTGLILSVLTVVALLINGWLGAMMARRQFVEVRT